jgi:hypothetical protein
MDHGVWCPVWTIEKYKDIWGYKTNSPYDTVCIRGNLLLNTGVNTIFSTLCGGSVVLFDYYNARIGVGDGSAAANASQTGLQGTNKAYARMEYGYPIYGSNQKVIFRAVFDANNGNFTWNEFTVDNGNISLNRLVSNQGVKVAGEIWIVTLEITIT